MLLLPGLSCLIFYDVRWPRPTLLYKWQTHTFSALWTLWMIHIIQFNSWMFGSFQPYWWPFFCYSCSHHSDTLKCTHSLTHYHSFTWSTRFDFQALFWVIDWPVAASLCMCLCVCGLKLSGHLTDRHLEYLSDSTNHNGGFFLPNKKVRRLTVVLNRCQTAAARMLRSAAGGNKMPNSICRLPTRRLTHTGY